MSRGSTDEHEFDSEDLSSGSSSPKDPNDVGPFDEGEIHVYVWSQESKIALEVVAQRYRMLLLTPELDVPRPDSVHPNSETAAHGPFGLLREHILKLHKRLVHIQYNVRRGLHREAIKKIQNIPYVFFIICEPDSPDPEVITESVARQRAAAVHMIDSYRYYHEGTEPDAIAVIYFGKRDFDVIPTTPICMKCLPWPEASVEAIVSLLLGLEPIQTDENAESDGEENDI